MPAFLLFAAERALEVVLKLLTVQLLAGCRLRVKLVGLESGFAGCADDGCLVEGALGPDASQADEQARRLRDLFLRAPDCSVTRHSRSAPSRSSMTSWYRWTVSSGTVVADQPIGGVSVIVNPPHVQRWIREELEAGKRPPAVLMAHGTLRLALKQAVL